jgi:hypothetical protein
VSLLILMVLSPQGPNACDIAADCTSPCPRRFCSSHPSKSAKDGAPGHLLSRSLSQAFSLHAWIDAAVASINANYSSPGDRSSTIFARGQGDAGISAHLPNG